MGHPGLRAGARIAVVSPASAAREDAVLAGCARLRAAGYEPVVMPHALSRGPLYFAGTREERVADLMAAFADEAIDAVMCTRGGWGSAELLPLLDARVIRANAKPFIGYSDHTSLHAWMWNECGLRTFHGPMVAADWAKDDGVDAASWGVTLGSRQYEKNTGVSPLRSTALRSGRDDGSVGEGGRDTTDMWSAGAAEGMRVLRAGPAVQGRLLGGCLAILCEGLGTPYSLRLTEPTVLFVEDVNVKPYQWDRMLQHLKFAGWMEHVVGVVLGDMSGDMRGDEMQLLEQACLHALGEFAGPVLIGLRSGHVAARNVTVPLGEWVALEGGELRVLR